MIPASTYKAIDTIKFNIACNATNSIHTWNLVEEVVLRTNRPDVAIAFGRFLGTHRSHTKKRAEAYKLFCDTLDSLK